MAASVRRRVPGRACPSQVSDERANRTDRRPRTHQLRVFKKAGSVLPTSERLQTHEGGRWREERRKGVQSGNMKEEKEDARWGVL